MRPFSSSFFPPFFLHPMEKGESPKWKTVVWRKRYNPDWSRRINWVHIDTPSSHPPPPKKSRSFHRKQKRKRGGPKQLWPYDTEAFFQLFFSFPFYRKTRLRGADRMAQWVCFGNSFARSLPIWKLQNNRFHKQSTTLLWSKTKWKQKTPNVIPYDMNLRKLSKQSSGDTYLSQGIFVLLRRNMQF